MTLNRPTLPNGIFPIGAVHHASFLKQSPAQTDAEYDAFIRSELTAMKESGFNTVSLELGWLDTHVAEERFDWTRTDSLWQAALDLEMKVTVWFFAELTPRWFTRAHPEARAKAASGYTGQSHSYGHPLARNVLRKWIHAALARYGNHPAVIAYNVGVESGLNWTRGPDSETYEDRLFDYNPAVIATYRTWLEERHGTIEQLNRLYRDSYGSFEEVEPPQSRFFKDGPMLVNQVPWLEWRQYICHLVADYIAFKRACVREIDPHRLVSDQSYGVDPAYLGQDIWQINRRMDAVGTSMFTSQAPGDYLVGNYLQDYHRSSARDLPFLIWELRAGQNAWGITNWGKLPKAEDIARFTWQVLGQGANLIQYWNWRPHLGGLEVGGHGFLARDGTLSDRNLRISQIARALNANANWFNALRVPTAKIAILDSLRSRIVASGESSDTLVQEAQHGLYAILKAGGHALDFVHEDQLTAAELARYRVLVLPFAYTLPTTAAKAIAEWVAGGGALVAGVFCAAKDEYGYGGSAVPGSGLDRVFGARELTLEPVFSKEDQQVSNFGEAWNVRITGRPLLTRIGLFPGEAPERLQTTLTGYRYLAKLGVDAGTRVLACAANGAPAVTVGKYGDGQAMLIGTVPVPEEQYADDGLSRLVLAFVDTLGVGREVTLHDRGGRRLEAKWMNGPGKTGLLVMLNAEEQVHRIRLTLNGRANARLTPIEEGGEAPVCEAGQWTVELAAGDARAFRVEWP
ncbi:beta-galactosidase [Nibricoccus sp. IMCC34717]|uniref:beta-galactosidase n=1 Tax=Nibricoccus sp. IMCC34717 TaxID=3034021 RepID=UPI00384EDA04